MILTNRNSARSPVAEAFRTIRTNIQFSNVDTDMKKILVTSSKPGEGKTTIISNLAITMASAGKKVIIIDMDLRKPKVHYNFEISNERGLTNILAGQDSFENIVSDTGIKNLSVLTSGPKPPNPAEILGSKRISDLIEKIEECYDYVFIDSPPLLAVTDAAVISTKVDGTIIVIEAGKTEIEDASEALKNLRNVEARIIGTVLNKIKPGGSRKYGYYYSSYYDVAETKKKRGRRK